MRTTGLTLQAFIVGLIIGGFYGDALGIRSATESRTIETLEATVATQRRTIETLEATVATQRRTIETQDAIIATQEETIALFGRFVGLDKTSPNAPLLAPNIYDN